nr:PREDICTED: LOW QUALITY PROTEIN: protein phosphatase 1 regulatory subunit 3G [Anolis carolinensis]|eukprot:XP_008118051.1 PREDICTED: LOW QUALITY PROTEIN: protein phosphatase 1 regulatory subunit 3G [Anolis carolinensis]
MESRGSAVLGLGQLVEALPWPGAQEEDEERVGEEEGAALRELRRRRGRSLSLPSSPTFPRREGDEEEEEGEGGVPKCCAKCTKKRVQFADSLGLCLASVKHFSAAEEPRVPPAVLSRLQSFPMRHKDLENFSAALASLRNSLRAPPPEPPQQRLLLLGRLPLCASVPVCLEEASGSCVDGAPSEARGVVRVQAGPGPKEVTVRYTFNEWLSFLRRRLAALFVLRRPAQDSASSSSSVERFGFSLCLPPGLEEGSAVHFAVCCRSPQGEHWDNNGGANYTLSAHEETRD